MPQQFGLDRLSRLSYLCLVAACAGPALQPEPAELAAVDRSAALAWVAATAPQENRLIRFKWLFNDGQASVGGQGSARLAAPDSMRFDIAGPWGIGGAAAVVVGDDPRWVRPPEIIARLIPSYPLMWAMFGVMRPPPPGAEIRGRQDGTLTTLEWNLGVDTVRYRRRSPGVGAFQAGWQRAGVTMGVVETKLDADGAPVSARLTVPSVPARLDLTIVADSTLAAFPAALWAPPAP
jgi:hypothetical protein